MENDGAASVRTAKKKKGKEEGASQSADDNRTRKTETTAKILKNCVLHVQKKKVQTALIF